MRALIAWLLLVAAACGDDPGGKTPDAFDTPDALDPALCQQAILLRGGHQTIDTCAGTNVVDGCGAKHAQEVVVLFMAPPGGGGTYLIHSNASISWFNPSCTGFFTCGPGFVHGGAAIIEDPAGGCGAFDVEVIGPAQP